jgi:MYXO-CTERM domain-containing protein
LIFQANAVAQDSTKLLGMNTQKRKQTMKFSNIIKLVGAGALSLSLSALPMVHSASAQDATGRTGTTGTTRDTTSRADVHSNDRLDWGWLGLLGLAGLAGLRGKKRDDSAVRYGEPQTPRTGTGSYRE